MQHIGYHRTEKTTLIWILNKDTNNIGAYSKSDLSFSTIKNHLQKKNFIELQKNKNPVIRLRFKVVNAFSTAGFITLKDVDNSNEYNIQTNQVASLFSAIANGFIGIDKNKNFVGLFSMYKAQNEYLKWVATEDIILKEEGE